MEYYLFFEDENGNLHQVGYVNGAGLESKEIMDSLWVQMEKYIHETLGVDKVWYYNIWNADGFTIVDYGSHSKFFRIRPIPPWAHEDPAV